MNRLARASAVVLVLLLVSTNVFAATYYIPDDYATFQAAVDGVADGDTIIVRDGTYTGAGNRDITFGEKSLTLQSENGPDNCIIDCQNAGRGLYFYLIDESYEIVVDGFTITNGSISGNPGGWLNNSGGGIYCQSASPTIKNCIIRDNYASSNGGGIMNSSSGLITNCVVTGNTSGSSGGGIRSINSWPTITDCVVTGNDAAQIGGGISLGLVVAGPDGGLFLNNCLVAGNTAASGGGISCNGVTTGVLPATITNCTVTGNTATTNAGGLYLDADVVVTVTDCILWGNTSPASPEIYLRDFSVWSPTLEIGYSDVAGGQAAIQLDPNATLTWNPGNIDSDPLFASGSLGDHYLGQTASGQGSDSPCLDAGSITAAAAGLDLAWTRTDGVVDGGVVDIGFHYGVANTPPPPCTYSILPTSATVGGSGGSDSVAVTSGGGCAWTATSNDAWITIDSGASGSGNGTVDYTVALNPSASPRTGSMTIAGETFTIDQAGSAVTYYVPDDFATIRAALSVVSSGDTIIVRDGTYSGRNLSFGGKDLILRSENGPESCIIDCGGANRGFTFWQGETSASILDGFTITNGSGVFGGGIYCVDSSPTIQNCIVKNNSADYGGGVCLSNSSAGMTNCTIVGNTANDGGGGIFFYNSNAVIKHCTIADNTAFIGGGIDCYMATRRRPTASCGAIRPTGGSRYIFPQPPRWRSATQASRVARRTVSSSPTPH